MRKTSIVLVSLFLLLLISAGVFYYLVKKKIITPFAQSFQTSLSLTPGSGDYYIGDQISVGINANTDNQVVTGIDIALSYDNTKLQFVDADPSRVGDQIVGENPNLNYTSVLVSNGLIKFSGTVGDQDPERVVSGLFATVRFSVIATAQPSEIGLVFDPQNPGRTNDANMVQKDPSNPSLLRDILASVSNASYNLNERAVPVTTVDIKADGQDGPISKESGQDVALTWTTANATSCEASNGWSGSKGTTGSETVSNLSASKIFTLTCTGTDNTSVADTVIVNVTDPSGQSPTVDLKVGGSDDSVTIPASTSTQLSWTSTNAASCTASGHWTGDKAISGSEDTGDLGNPKQYILTCQNSAGVTASDEVIVLIQSPPSNNNTNNTNDTNTNNPDTSNTANNTNNTPTNTETPVTESPQPVTQPTSPSTTAKPPVQTSKPSPLTSSPTQLSKKPDNIKPTSPTNVKPNSTVNNKKGNWKQIIIYTLISAFLAGGIVFAYILRKKANKKDNVI